jgi:putative inorganic carbon (hco3(-)) transporter
MPTLDVFKASEQNSLDFCLPEAKIRMPRSSHNFKDTMLKSISHYLRLPSSLKSSAQIFVFLALTLSIASILVSIAVSQILLAVALIGWIATTKRPDIKSTLKLPFILPLCLLFAWTILTSLIAPNSLSNLWAARKFFLFLLLFLVPAIIRGEGKTVWTCKAIFIVSALSGGAGMVQYLIDPERDLLHRIKGFMSHWMTYSGLLMLVLVLLISYALSVGWRKHKWILLLSCFITIVLILSQTRTALIGAIAGACVMILLKQPRAIIGLLAIIIVLFVFSPAKIKQRLHSSITTQDPRIEIWGTSLRLIKENPWFGVGLTNVNREALRYRGNYAYPDWAYQHMHNNFLQIAAERGIPGLVFWVWLLIRFGWDALGVYRASRKTSLDSTEASIASLAALGALTALLIAGIGEYNFGDSEILVLFLFIISAPYAFLPEPHHE